MGTLKKQIRHYKKDTRFLLDLYTLTYDSNESLETVAAVFDFGTPKSYSIYGSTVSTVLS
ncbi:hypothetical protein J437_LFUL006928 [Ladona fulva]|uniref:Uncharacterized protein n=1 Tax=Ladona fulva TaxID=123851 RepID=A0A8K0KBY6_LADFU|nr:hypothetical protein J437_LFUL006928 [Ladona fulva]